MPTGGDKSGVTSKSISVPKGSGTVKGMGESFSAQLSTGIATYSVPFALPSARGGVQPSLGLSYSSSGGHGSAGVGWNVGSAFIARQTDRGLPTYDDRAAWHPNQDRFVFNGGQELVPICDVGDDLSCAGMLPTEQMPAWSGGWQYHRARVEGGFMRFFWSPDRLTWRVQSKSGQVLELGVPLDGSGQRDALETNASHPQEIYRWYVSREYDTYTDTGASDGMPLNVVYYRYLEDGGSKYLADIYDTTPVDAPTTRDFGRYAHHTHLSWEVREDTSHSYRSGWRMEQNLRLARVDVSSASEGAEERGLVRRYILQYDPQYHVSLLENVQVFGRCEQTVLEDASGLFPGDLGCQGEGLPPMTFGYSHVGNPTDDGWEPFDNEVRTLAHSPPHSLDEAESDLFDINSDGLPDVLVTAPGYYSGGFGWFENGGNGQLEDFADVQKITLKGVLGANASTLKLSNLNLVPLDLDGDGHVNLLHMPKTKTYSVYDFVKVGNAYQLQGRVIDTAKGQSPKIDFGKDTLDTQVMDVNFDGLVDVVVTTGTQVQTFFSLGRLPGGDGQFGVGKFKSASTADLSVSPEARCVPHSGLPIRFSDSETRVADMNADGIPDIVRVQSGAVRYWPGRGNGYWGTGELDDCPKDTFGQNRHVLMTESPTTFGEALRLDDVNGDGYPDLVNIRMNEIDVWLNVNGERWTKRKIVTGTPPTPSYLNRVRLVDVDGSGTRDVLWGNGNKYQYIDLQGGSRPWILTEVNNGLGKTTTLEYTSSADEMLAARAEGKPWDSTVPMILHLVKRMTESDNLNVFSQGPRTYTTEYSYRDPVYDGRQREFRGFREATSTTFGDSNSPTSHARSEFLLGECQYADGSGCAVSDQSFDNPNEALKGLPVVSESYDSNGVYLSTSHTHYTLRKLYQGLDGRGVVYAFAQSNTAWAYDTNSPANFSSPSTQTLETVTPEASSSGLGVSAPPLNLSVTVRATAGTVRTEGFSEVDDFGNALRGVSKGCVSGCPSGHTDDEIEQVTDPVLLPHDSGWLWRTATSYTTSRDFPARRGETATSYTAEGAPYSVTAVLTGTEALQRSHETPGADVAPTPGDAVADSPSLFVSQAEYDQFGNAIRSYAPGGRCADVFLDTLYAQLATTEMMYPSGCPGTRDLNSPPEDALYTAAAYDRGLELVTNVIDVSHQVTRVEYDGFGRLTKLFRSEPGAAMVGSTPAVEISYDLATPSRPYSVIYTKSQDGATTGDAQYMESYGYVDGMGRALVGISEADPSANDEQDWIVGGFVDYDKKGAVRRKYLPKFWAGDPKNFPLTEAPGTPFGRVEYDAFGREVRLYDLDPEHTQTLLNVYRPLSSDAWDAADLQSGGPHEGTYVTSISDGHGRGVLGIERFKENASLIERRTETQFLPTGEPLSITRSSIHGSTTRWLRYDSLGRMVLNVEPHTSDNFNPDPFADASNIQAWRYLYNASGELVGTSDARGCGVNFAYDGVGRLRYEDYSPCQASHQPYSPPAPDTASGMEVYYLYDQAPPSELGAIEVPNGSGSTDAFTPLQGGDYLRGKLVAVFDRAKVSVTNYDGRSRAFESWVRLAAPGVPNDSMLSRYNGRWYRKQVAFDGADRVVSETTGAQSPELMGSDGQSHVDIAYSNRGTVKSVGGSYGELVTDIKRTADGLHEHIEYGDLARTRTQFAYDTRRRLATVQTYRGPPAAWSDPSSSYSHAGIGTDTFQKVLQDDHYHYDVVGNPWKIEDLRNPDEWPAGAKPVTRTMQYDDLYRVNRVDYGYTERDDSVTQPTPTPNPWGLGPSGSRTRATPRISAAELTRFHQETAKSPSLAGVQPKSAAASAQGAGVSASGVAKLTPPPPPPAPAEPQVEPEGEAEPAQAHEAQARATAPKGAQLEAKPSLNQAALKAVKLPDVSQVPAPKVTAITNQSPSGALTAPYVFTWTGVSDATGYNFRIYDGEGYHFDREVSVADLGCSGGGTCTFDLANASPAISLGQGAARWNVRIVGGSDDGDWASWVNVSVGNVEPLTASTMTAPPSVVGAPFVASWTGSLGASHYVFDMRRVSDNVQVFGQTRQKYEVCTGTNCSITFQPSATGDYTIRIQSNSEHNLNGPWSNTLSFHEDVEGPRPITPAALTPDFSGYSFTHRASLIQYRIRWVAQDGTSHEATNNPACGVSGVCTYNWTRTLPDGGAAWAVQGGFGGGVWTPYVWQDIAFGSLPTLTAPTLASPTARTGYFGKLYWEPILGIAGYDIEVLDGSGTLLESYSLTKAELRCDNPDTHDLCEFQPADQSVGDYQWRIRAVGLDSAPGPWSPTTAFSITTSPAPPVGPLTPNTLIGAGAAGSTDFYRWSSTPTGQFRAQLFTAYGGTPTETTPLPSWAGCSDLTTCYYGMPRPIAEGGAVWGVQYHLGSPGMWSAYQWQDIAFGDSYPTLAAPIQYEPAGLVGSPVTPKWKPEVGVRSYDFELFDGSGNPLTAAQYTKKELGCDNPTSAAAICKPAAITLGIGSYSWRVRARGLDDAPGPWSASLAFTIDEDGPTPVAPAGEVTGQPPVFRWTPRSGVVQYHLRVWDGDGGLQQLYILPGNAGCANNAGICQAAPWYTIPQGAAYWEVRGGFSIYADTGWRRQNFSIGPITPFQTPVQLSPSGLVGAPFDLEWEFDSAAAKYAVSIKTPEGTEVYATVKARTELSCGVLGNTCTLPDITIPSGNYIWYVRPLNAQGTLGPWSAGLAFEVDADPPNPVWPNADITDNDDTPTYVFTELPGATAYYFSIAEASGVYHLPTQLALTDVDCDGGVCRYTSPIPLEEGAARWGIRGRDASNVWGTWRYSDFSYHGVPVLSVPTPLSPNTTTTSPVAAQWSADPAATYYDFWITPAAGGTPLHYSRTNKHDAGCPDGTGICTGPSVALPTGEYRWTVASVNVHERGALSTSMYFSVDNAAPTPLTPTGEISDNTPVYRFTQRSDATQYRMTVLHSTGYAGRTIDLSEVSCSGGVCEYTLLDTATPDPNDEYVLPPGAGRWHVEALVNGTWTPEHSVNFSVGPYVTPGPLTAISPNKPTKSPVSFQWTPDAGSHRYYLQVYDTNNALVFSSNRYAADLGCADLVSNCVWSDVSLPDGNYTWTVKGFNQQNATYGWTTPMAFSVYTETLNPIYPVGEISEARPTYTFSEQQGANYYQVTLIDALGTETLVVPAIDANCFAGTCSVDLPRDVQLGAAFWRVRAEMGSAVWTPYVSLNFSRGPIEPVGATTAIAPYGPVVEPLTYRWSAATGAQRYYLQVQDLNGVSLFGAEYTSAQVGCAAGELECSITLVTGAGLGHHRWHVRPHNVQNEYGPWSNLLDFNVGELPGELTILAPVGNLHDSLPVYSWTSDANSAWYELKLEDAGGAVTTWILSPSEASCTPTQCTYTPAHVLDPGSHTVWVRGVSNRGAGPWSQPEQFYLVPNLTDQDDSWDDPNADPSGEHRRAEPSPYQEFEKRIRYQTWNYDWLGNTTETDDDAKGFYDRSLGSISNGPVGGKAYQLNSASNRGNSGTKEGDLSTTYDVTGNLTDLYLHRDGQCVSAGAGCKQYFHYEWDEVGRLVTAKRWDQNVASGAQPSGVADVELHYGYDASDMRVSKRAVDTQGEESYTLYIFGSLELRRTEWNTTEQDFHLDAQTEVAYLFANGVRLARLAYEEPGDVPSINGENLHVFFELGDHLGSTSVVLDKATSELVERSTYQAYGGSESDYRPERWKHFREDYRFTGKEEDVEVGLIYFGKRFLNPLLNRWISADPLAVHGLGADPNLYAYVSGRVLQAVDPLGLEPENFQSREGRGGQSDDAQPQDDSSMALGVVEGLSEALTNRMISNLVMLTPGLGSLMMMRGLGEGLVKGAKQLDEHPESAIGAFQRMTMPTFKLGEDIGDSYYDADTDRARGRALGHGSVEMGYHLAEMATMFLGGEFAEMGSATTKSLQLTRPFAGGAARKASSAAAAAESEALLQLTENSCGQTCGTMLLRDRGFDISRGKLANVTDYVGRHTTRSPGEMSRNLQTWPEALADGMNEVQPGWKGAKVEFKNVDTVKALNKTGSWGALIRSGGGGHWVVVDGLKRGRVILRDPGVGITSMKLGDFLGAWEAMDGGLVFRP